MPTIAARPDTQDADVFAEVITRNEYLLPPRFAPGSIVLDLGAHIGCFTLACILRGASNVWAFEPDYENFTMLQRNVGDCLEAKLHKRAVWRSDSSEQVYFSGHPPWATACGSVVHDCTVDGQNAHIPVHSTGLDAILDQVGPVALCKIDIEGAEYEVLYTCKNLRQIQRIVGETHDIGIDHTTQDLVAYLEGIGYKVDVEVNPHNTRMSKFWAERV